MAATYDEVKEQLDCAVANGFTFEGWTTEAIIQDLQTFSAVCEDCSEDELRPHVESWLRKHRGEK